MNLINYRNFRIWIFLLAFSVCSGNANASLDQPPDYLEWKSIRNVSESNYQARLDEFKKKGYRPIDVEIRGGTVRKYSAVWRKNTDGRAWGMHTKLTNKGFSQKWNEYKDKGYRPIDLETYVLGSKRYYGGIWIKNKENLRWASHRRLTSQEFSNKFKEYKAKGYLPIDLDGYKAGTKFLYSVIWVKNTDNVKWALVRNIRKSEFGKKFDAWSDKGYRLYDTESYVRGGRREYATIWVKESKPRAWKARRDMTGQWFYNYWAKYRDLGYRLEDIEAYRTSKGVRYAGVWVENSSRLAWKHRRTVNNLVKDYLSKNKSAGFSVAISEKGKIKYMRGWGFANVAKDKEAHSRTVFRLASVSKAITGVLAFRLEQKGKLTMSKKTRGYEPRIPSHHTHTVAQLITNRGRVRHYKNNDPATSSGTTKVYTSAYGASKLFSADPLVSKGYKYSTHGYTLAAAALEKATGKSFTSLVYNRLNKPFGITTLRCENRKKSNGERSAIYSVSGSGKLSKLTALSLSWKYAGGGMECSAYDLVRFGSKLIDGKIISTGRLNKMTTKPDNLSNYAYGWDTGTDQGNKVFAKSGGQPGGRSYMRLYPDKRIVIVLLANTRGDGVSQLGRDIGKVLVSK